jgi:pilus assembly protein Flp/PilA
LLNSILDSQFYHEAPKIEEAILKKNLLNFLRDTSGATAIEYGLIAAGIAVVIITVVQGVGTNLTTTFGSVSSALK